MMNQKANPPDPSLPVSQLVEIDKICRRFEAAWKTGKQPRIEEFLGDVSEPQQGELRRELESIDAEYRQKVKKPTLDVFIETLSGSGLMTHAEVQTFLTTLPADKRPADAETLAREMFKQGKLTKFQAQAIFQGKTRGLVVGNYVVLDTIGKGGMGAVYKARHRKMDRLVAIKMLPSTAMKSPEVVKRFEREVKAAARLSHPNIVTAHDADEHNGVHFLVMEYVEGQDLASMVKQQGPLPVATAVDYIVQAAKGLEYAHGERVIHRDIKPANLLVDRKGTVKILDMGLARVDGTAGAIDEGLTRDGQVMGTLDYMAPEQAMDTHRADARSDIYSLGCTLHYLLAGRGPFSGETVGQKIVAHRELPVPSLRTLRPDVPESLDAVFLKMLAKKPQDRQASMGEVMAQLQGCTLPKTPAPVITPAAPSNVADTFSLRQGDIETSSEQIPANPLEEIAAAARAHQSIAPKPVAKKWLKRLSKRQKIGVGVALGLAFALVLFGVIFKLRTKEGTLIVEVSDPDVTVQVLSDEGKVQIERKGEKGTLTIAVDPGKHRLRVQKNGVEMFAKEVSIASGGTETIKAVLELPDTSSVAQQGNKTTDQKLPESGEKAADLLSRVDPTKHGLAGDWKAESGKLVSPADGLHVLQTDVDAPEQYDMVVTVSRNSGKEPLAIGLIHKGKLFEYSIDAYQGLSSAFLVDRRGQSGNDVSSTQTSNRITATPTTFRFAVRAAAVTVYQDGKLIAGWSDYTRLLPPNPAWHVREQDKLFLGSWESSFTVSSWKLQAVEPQQTDPDRRAAEWMLKNQGQGGMRGLGILVNGNVSYVNTLGDLPAMAFTILRIEMSDELRRALMAEKKANGECGLAELKQLKRLRSVWMQFQPTEDGDVEKLARELPGLEQLGLARTLVSNVGLQHIEKLSALRDLSLSGTRVTDSGLEHISRLGNLEDLSLGVNSRITDIAITYLAGLPRLTNLSLEKTAITDKGLGTLGGMGLHNLRLDGTAITDGGLEHLTSLKNLRVLNLSGTKVTAVGVAKLQAALPNCKITVDPAIQAELDKLKK